MENLENTDIDAQIDEAVHDVNLRLFSLKSHTPICFACHSADVQLISLIVPAWWRCKKCLFVFQHEPKE